MTWANWEERVGRTARPDKAQRSDTNLQWQCRCRPIGYRPIAYSAINRDNRSSNIYSVATGWISVEVRTGASIPLRQWCISPLFHISPYFRKFLGTPRKISPIWPFPKTISDFHPPKFLTTAFFEFLPISPVLAHIPPISGIFSFPPIFAKISLPDFVKLTCFYILYMYFVSSYFYHDAFMHHTMHVLDALE